MPLNEDSKNIYDEIGITSKQNYKAICRLTEPINAYFGIDRFWRNVHRADGSYSLIGNYPPTAELFFGLNLYKGHPYFRNPVFFQSGYMLPELLHREDYEKTQGRLAHEGDCFHVFIIIRKEEQGFVEYGFATSKLHAGFEMVYLNHLAAINKFIDYFDDNALKIIQKSDEYRINIPLLVGHSYEENPRIPGNLMVPEKELAFLAAVDKRADKAQALFTLTKSERNCLKLFAAGYTAREIGEKLYRSPRTIESHLEIAKEKLDLKTRSSLTEFLTPYLDVL